MNRLLVLALVASIGNASAAFAEESLLTAGARHVKQIAVAESTATALATTAATPNGATVRVGKKATPAFQAQQGGNISKSGMSKGAKTMLYVGMAAGFVASVYAIDHGVKDITPSSLGTRKD